MFGVSRDQLEPQRETSSHQFSVEIIPVSHICSSRAYLNHPSFGPVIIYTQNIIQNAALKTIPRSSITIPNPIRKPHHLLKWRLHNTVLKKNEMSRYTWFNSVESLFNVSLIIALCDLVSETRPWRGALRESWSVVLVMLVV